MPISEEDALGALALAEANKNDPAVVLKAKDIAVAYEAQQKAAGLPMFPQQERQREEQFSTLRSFYTDPNHGMDNETLGFVSETLRDSPDSKYKIFNKKYFEFHGVPKDQVDSNIDQLINAYGLQEYNRPISSHKEFFDSIKADFQTQDQVSAMAGEFAVNNVGTLMAESQFLERMEGVPGYAGREEKWKEELFNKKFSIDSRLDPHRATIKLLSSALMTKESVGVEATTMEQVMADRQEVINAPSYEELSQLVIGVPAEDRKLVISAAIAASANDEAGRKSVLKGLLESFDRGIEGMAADIKGVGDRSLSIAMQRDIASGVEVPVGKEASPEEYLEAVRLRVLGGDAYELQAGVMGVIAGKQFAAPSEEVKQQALKLAENEFQIGELADQLRSAAQNEIDPISSEFIAVRGLYSAAQSVPYLVTSLARGGFAINAMSLAGDSYRSLREQNPTMTAEQAQTVSMISGPAQAYVEQIRGSLLTGRLTSFNRFFNQILGTKGSIPARYLTRTAAITGAEMFQENVQQLTPFMVQGIISAVSEDMPNVPVGMLYEDMVAQQPELFFAVLPLAIMGGGAGTYSDFRNGRALLSSFDELRYQGLSEEASADIRALAAKKDYDGAQARLREEFKTLGRDQKSVQEARAEVLPKLLAEQAATLKAMKDGMELDILPAILNERGKFTLRFTNGETMQYETHAEAMERFDAIASSSLVSMHVDQVAAARLTTSQIEQGREVKFILSPLRPTTEELQGQGVATEEQLEKRKEIEELNKGITPKDEERRAQVLAGMAANSSEARIASSYVLGSSQNTEAAPDSFGDRVIRTTARLYAGATAFTVIEETAEGDVKFMLQESGVPRKWLISALRQWESTTGDALFRKSITDDKQVENQDIVEAYSKMVVSYFASRAKAGDQGRIFSKEFRKEIADALRGDMGAVMSGYGSFFEAVYRRAAMIEKARKEKTLPADLESFLAKSAGMSPQKVFEREVVKEGEGIARELQESGTTLSVMTSEIPVNRMRRLMQQIDAMYSTGRTEGVENLEAELEILLDKADSDLEGMDENDDADQVGEMLSSNISEVDSANPSPEEELINQWYRWTGKGAAYDGEELRETYPTFGAFVRAATGDNAYVVQPGVTDEQIEEAAKESVANYERRRTAMLRSRVDKVTFSTITPAVMTDLSEQEQGILPEPGDFPSTAGPSFSVMLSAVHNLTADNLRFAAEMGGLAVPSIAVVPSGNVIDGFGEITLVGGRPLADPEANPVFDADAYTQRFPRPEWKKVPMSKAQPLIDKLRPYFSKNFGQIAMSLRDIVWDNTVNRADPEEAISRAKNSLQARAAYLGLTQGVTIEPVERPAKLNIEEISHPIFLEYLETYGKTTPDWDDKDGRRRITDAFLAASQAVNKEKYQSLPEKDREALISKENKEQLDALDEDGFLPFSFFPRLKWEIEKIGKTEPDIDANEQAISEALSGKESEFYNWIENEIRSLFNPPRLKVEGKYEPYTIDNIVRAMTSGKIAGSEKTMAFSEGQVRAIGARQFKNLDELRNFAEWSIKSEEEIKEIRAALKPKVEEWRSNVSQYYKYSDTWDALNNSMAAMARYLKGPRTSSRMFESLRVMDFQGVPKQLVNEAMEIGQMLIAAPVPYFESKPQRVVRLSEFSAAIVPSDIDLDVIGILESNGITVEKYDASVADSRLAAMKSVIGDEITFSTITPAVDAESGNIIPLSQRFNPARDEISFSTVTPGGIRFDEIAKEDPINDGSRVGTAWQGKRNPTTQDTNDGIATVVPKELEKQMKMLTHFVDGVPLPAFITKFINPEEKMRAFIEFQKGNLLALYDAFEKLSRNYVVRSTHWYDGARLIAEGIRDASSVTVEQAAAIIAVFSPMKDWFQNVAMAQRFADVMANHKVRKITQSEMGGAMQTMLDATEDPETIGQIFEKIEGNSITDLLNDRSKAGRKIASVAVRLVSQHVHGLDHDVLSPEGESLGVRLNRAKGKKAPERKKLVWQSYTFIEKAISIYEDGSLNNISKVLGTEHKIRNFYNNIVSPTSPYGDATVDTHAVNAAVLFPMGNKGYLVGLNFGDAGVAGGGNSGLYWIFHEALREAAAERGVSPRQMQSITWEAIRGLFTDVRKRDKNFIATITKIWEDAEDANTARSQIVDLGITPPEWARVDLGDSQRKGSMGGDQGKSTDSAGSVRSGVRQGGAGRDTGAGVGATLSVIRPIGDIDSRFTAMFSPFHRSPELRAKLGQEMRRRALEVSKTLAPILRANRTAKSIDAERKQRFDALWQEKMEARISPSELSAIEAGKLDDASTRPILSELLRKKTYKRKDGKTVEYWAGSLMSKAEAKRRGMDTTSGEWDDIPEGLPGYVYGGGLAPDQAASMFGFDSIADFWSALESEIASWKNIEGISERISREIADITREARSEARAWANQALKERGTIGSDRATLIGFLRTLDAIQRTLPVEVRGKIGGYVALAELSTPAAMLEEIERRVQKIDVELERYLKKEATAQVKKFFKSVNNSKNTKAGEAAKGKSNLPEIYTVMDLAEKAYRSMSAEEGQAEGLKLQGLVDSGAVADDDVAATEMAAELIPLFAGWNGRTQDQVIDGKKKRVRISSQSDSAQRFAALEAAKEMWSKGMLEAKMLKAEQKERRDRMRAEGEADIAKTSKLKTRDERDAFSEKRRSIAGRLSLDIMNIDGFFRWHLGDNSNIYRWISDSERKAANAYDDSVRSIAKSVDDWFTARAGSRFAGEKLRLKMAKDRVDIKPEKGEVRKMTQLQMITAKLIWRQDDGKRHMKGRKDENGNIVSDWSYGDKFMQQINDAMSDEAIALFDFLSDAYAAEYDSINKVYRRLFGINLPKHLFYAPLTMNPETLKDSGADPVTGFFSGGLSGISGALKSRGTSITEPDFKDALQTYVSHSMQMEHFKAFAELAREAKAIFGRKSFRDQIKRASGEEGVTVLNGLLEQLDKGGIRSAALNLETTKLLENLIGRLSTMILFGKLGTVALNVTQMAATAAEVGPRRYLVQLSKLLYRPSNWAKAFKSEFIQRRIEEMPAIVRQVQDSQKRLGPSRLADINDKLGYGISTTDGFFTAATYAMIYDLKKQEAKKLGIPVDQIEAFAKNEAERITERLAQPTRKGAKSIYENNLGAEGRALFNFISESRKNMALIAYAFKKDPSKLPGTAMYVILNAMIASVIRAAWQDLRDDDEDEDEAIYNPYKLALEIAIDPVYGIPVVGGMLQDLIKASFGFKTFGGTLLEGGENAIPAARRMIALDYDPEEIDRAVSDTNAILGLLGIFDRRLASITAITNVVEDVAKVYDNLTQD